MSDNFNHLDENDETAVITNRDLHDTTTNFFDDRQRDKTIANMKIMNTHYL